MDMIRPLAVAAGLLPLLALGYAFWRRQHQRRTLAAGPSAEAQPRAAEGDTSTDTQRLMTVLDGMEDRIYLADMDTHELLFMNQSAIQALGQGVGRPCYQVLQGLAAPCPFCTNDKLVNPDGTPAGVYHWEFQNLCNHHWYELRDCALRWPDGRLVRLEVATDITERKQAEQRCLDQEHRWRLALEGSGLGVWDWNILTGQVFYSPRWKAMLGYQEDDIGDTLADWESRVHPEDLPGCYRQIKRYISGETPGYRSEHRMLCKDGSYRWILDKGMVCEWTADRQPVRMLGTHADIHERKLNEAALRSTQERLEAMVNALPDLLFRLDREGHLLESQGFDPKKFFVPPTQFLGRKVAEVLPPEVATIIMAALDEAARQGWHRGATYVLPMPEGLRWYELSIARMGEPAQPDPQFIVLARDITLRKQAEAALQILNASLEQRVAERTAALEAEIAERQRKEVELRQARDLAEQANAAKSEFLARMSHEIRTPLYSVLGLAQMINREPLSAQQRNMVGRIQTAGESLLGILNDILDLAKIEAGYLHIDARPFTLSEVLKRLDDLYGPTARDKGLGWRLELPPLPPGLLTGDDLRLEQVMTNLIGNALKFTDQGEIRIRLQVLEAREQQLRLRFAVQDTGIGISPADQGCLFTPFTQLEGGHNRRYAGTGLGLPISQRLIEMMGGVIGVDSQPGQGSTFWFELSFPRVRSSAPEPPGLAHTGELPSASPSATALGPPAANTLAPSSATTLANALASPPASPSASLSATSSASSSAPTPARRGAQLLGLRVLVVDDSPEHRDLMHQALGLEGALVTEASDGAQALDFLRDQADDCDLVLMDLQMPGMDGFTATRLIRNELGLMELPIIALTAGVLPEQRQAAFAVGVDEILTKPIDLDQIAARLSPWMGTQSPPLGMARTDQPLDAFDAGAFGEGAYPIDAFTTDTFPEIAGISRAQVEKNLAGDLARFRTLLRGFRRQFTSVVAEVRTDLAGGREEEAAQRLHRLRGYAGSIGAMALMGKAGRLEDAVRRGETGLDAALTQLDGDLAALIAASQVWLDAEGTSSLS